MIGVSLSRPPSSSASRWLSGVSTQPGGIAVTPDALLGVGNRQRFGQPDDACLRGGVGLIAGFGHPLAIADEVLTIAPPPRSSMCGTTA